MGYNVRIGKSEHASKWMQMLAAAAGSDACERVSGSGKPEVFRTFCRRREKLTGRALREQKRQTTEEQHFEQ